MCVRSLVIKQVYWWCDGGFGLWPCEIALGKATEQCREVDSAQSDTETHEVTP
jgi:hypothetical protein